ncbi:hypothetical protein [Streptomyces coeruleorubidus]|uniref:hypothetical protein n=1 Tax=Streptomyces coeruleorubidus TaxID=116188 RepID=UPI0033B48F45
MRRSRCWGGESGWTAGRRSCGQWGGRRGCRGRDRASVLQSWLDSPAADEYFSRSEVYRAVVASRHRTLEHLLQIPADEILSRHEPEIALKILLNHCGRRTKRWAALAAAMTFAYDEEQISFGEFLDALDHAPEKIQAP